MGRWILSMAFRARVALALGASIVMIAIAGGVPAASAGNKACVEFCKSVFPPGATRGQCIAEAAQGRGPCFEGYCVPAPPEDGISKDKDPFDEKLAQVVASAEVPSAMAGAQYQMLKRFVAGDAPAGELEEAAFGVLASQPAQTQELFGCSLRRIEALSLEDRLKLFAPEFAPLSGEPVTKEALASAIIREINQRASLAAFDESDPTLCVDNERAGLSRVVELGCPNIDGDFDGPCARICSLDAASLSGAVRTIGFTPRLTAAEREAAEVQEIEQRCTIDPDDPTGEMSCENVLPSEGCTGNTDNFENLCLTVPNVEAGERVLLAGINFSHVDAQVEIREKGVIGGIVRTADAHLCGDVDAPLSVPPDCRNVMDRLIFEVPADTPAGLYQLRLNVPDANGDILPFFDTFGPVIRVVPPADSEFELASEELLCIDESGRTDIGSDEPAILISTIPFNSDLTLGEMRSETFRFGDVDDGDRRRLGDPDSVVFNGAPGQGVILSLMGWEVDNEAAFQEQITNFGDAWVEFQSTNWNIVVSSLNAAGAAVASIWIGETAAAAIALSAHFAISATFAIWAPADLLIEDAQGISNLELGDLTSINFPKPPTRELVSSQGVDIEVAPCDHLGDQRTESCPPFAKDVLQYHERREYRHSRATYQIILRYNRLP